MISVILAGGPAHGKTMEMDEPEYPREGQTLAVADSGPVIDAIRAQARHPARPSRRHPLARLRWTPAPEPAFPAARVSVYRRTGMKMAGRTVYWHAGERPPAPSFRDDPGRLLRYLYQALDAGGPFRDQGHFEMGSEWYNAVRHVLTPEDGDYAPGDMILGLEVRVAEGWGPPILIEPR